MGQGVLPFKLEITKERITARSSLVLYMEFLHAISEAMFIFEQLVPVDNRF